MILNTLQRFKKDAKTSWRYKFDENNDLLSLYFGRRKRGVFINNINIFQKIKHLMLNGVSTINIELFKKKKFFFFFWGGGGGKNIFL